MAVPRNACLIIEVSKLTYDLDDYDKVIVNVVELGHRLELAAFGEIEGTHLGFILIVKERLVLRPG